MPKLAEFVKKLLSKGVSKKVHDELLEKLPTPGNCNHIEVV